jgi:hypothetical protein
MTTYVDLATLPEDHPLRNRALADINAEYSNKVAGSWKVITPGFGIARFTFNELAHGPWPMMNNWRAPT